MTRWALAILFYCSFALADDSPIPMRFCYEDSPSRAYLNLSNRENPGFFIELLQATANNSGLRIEFYAKPWLRCTYELQHNQADSMGPVIWQPERDVWGYFPNPQRPAGNAPDVQQRLWQVNYRIIASKNTQLSWDGARFTGLREGLSAPQGHVALKPLQELNALAPVRRDLDRTQVLQLIEKGRLDGYILEEQVAQELLIKYKLEQRLTVLSPCFISANWYVPFSKAFYQKYSDLVERFWAQLEQQRKQLGPELARRYQIVIPDFDKAPAAACRPFN